MNFIQPHHLINDQDCMVAEDVLTNKYNIIHDKSHIKIENMSGKDASWISSEYFAVEGDREKILVFDHVMAEYPNEQKRIVLARHLVAETKRLAAQENYPQNIVVSLPKKFSEGIKLHHQYKMWKGGLKLPNDRVLSAGNCSVIWMGGGWELFTVRDWAQRYCLNVGMNWEDRYWRY